MKQFLYILFVIIFIGSCTSNTIYKKPENLIPKDQMIDLLVDMQIAIGARSTKNNNGDYGVNYMPFVFEKYQIDSVRFAESSFYYTTDIDSYNKMLQKVKTRIEKMNEENEIKTKELDSIKKDKKTKNTLRPPKEPTKKELKEMQAFKKNDSIIK